MIDRSEIDQKAKTFAIRPADVERDYVFGWLLFGLFTESSLKDRLFLKGGNALRKGYFENTRYSGDLDFGMTGDVGESALLEEINRVCDFVEKANGVSFVSEQNRVKEKFVPSDGPSATPNLKVYEVRVYFRDFYGKPGHVKVRVSMDITRYDKTLLPLQQRTLIHPYSDAQQVHCQIPCTKLEEIIATKLKCLMQREHAPDLFDYVYAIKQLGMDLDRGEVVRTFIQKTIFGRNPFLLKSILRDATPLEFIRATWSVTVVCAQKFAIDVEDAIAAFVGDLELLFAEYSDNGYAQFAYFPAPQRAIIRRAGREQTLLRVQYKGAERLVEPYSLKYMQKRTGEEQEYLSSTTVAAATIHQACARSCQ